MFKKTIANKDLKTKISIIAATIFSVFIMVHTVFPIIANINNRKPINPNNAPGDDPKKVEDYEAAHPIIRDLPINYAKYDPSRKKYVSYKIEGGLFDGCKTDFCLKVIDYSGDGTAPALEKLREYGYNLDNFEIIHEPPADTNGQQ